MTDELLKLSYLIGPGETHTQIRYTRGFVTLQDVDHHAGWSKPHEPTAMDTPTIVLLEKGASQGCGSGSVIIKAHRRVHAEGEPRERPPVCRQGFLTARAERTAVVIRKVRRNDPIAQPGKAIELCW